LVPNVQPFLRISPITGSRSYSSEYARVRFILEFGVTFRPGIFITPRSIASFNSMDLLEIAMYPSSPRRFIIAHEAAKEDAALVPVKHPLGGAIIFA